MKKNKNIFFYIATVIVGFIIMTALYVVLSNISFNALRNKSNEESFSNEKQSMYLLQITLVEKEKEPISEVMCYLISGEVILEVGITDDMGKVVFENIETGYYTFQIALTQEQFLDYVPLEEKKMLINQNKKVEFEIEQKTKRLVLRMVGDNLIHSQINRKAYSFEEKEYNYEFLYEGIKEELETADIAIINQETIFVADRNNISTYPRFGTPIEMGESLKNVGFNVICCASNHAADKGELGVTDALEFWKDYPEITICGIYSSQEDKEQIRVIEKNGIKVAILNYTYGLNGLSFPKDKQYLTNILDSKERIKNEIIQAKLLADVVVISPHMGTEYSFKPSKYQREWVDFFVEAGADVIIGTHPHVLEPYFSIDDTVVFYSIGNFVSNQKEIPTILGGMAEVVFEKNGNDISVLSYQCIPLVTHYTNTEHMVYKLSDYTEELASKHTMNQYDSRFSKDYLENLYYKIMHGMDDEILNLDS